MARQMIAALQVSLDGFTQGSDPGGADWIDSWADAFALVPDVDTFVQGAGMYPGYGQYWESIYKEPVAVTPFLGRAPTARELEYARLAAKAPHYVLSTTLQAISWPPTARIVRSLGALRALKSEPGKNIYVVGGPTLVTSLLNENLLDELKLIVHPLLLGGGKALFAGVTARRPLRLVESKEVAHGRVVLSYRP